MSESPSKKLAEIFEDVQSKESYSPQVTAIIDMLHKDWDKAAQSLLQVIAYFHTNDYDSVQGKAIIMFLSKLYYALAKSIGTDTKKAQLLNDLLAVHMHAYNVNRHQKYPSLLLVKTILLTYPKKLVNVPQLIELLSGFVINVVRQCNNMALIFTSLAIMKELLCYESDSSELLVRQIKLLMINKAEGIRKSAIYTIPMNKIGIKSVMPRIRDVSIKVRRAVFKRLQDENCFMLMTPHQRIELVQSGLSDVNEGVRKDCQALLRDVLCSNQISGSLLSSEKSNLLHSPMKNKQCKISYSPGQFIALFDIKKAFANYKESPILKLLVEFILKIYDDNSICEYLESVLDDLIKLAHKDPNEKNQENDYIEEGVCVLFYTFEIWEHIQNYSSLSQLSDHFINSGTYKKLFQIYMHKNDYVMLYFIIPLIKYIDSINQVKARDILSTYEDFILNSKTHRMAKPNYMSISYIVSKWTGMSTPKCMNDVIGEIVKGVFHLLKNDTEELLSWFYERISDIIEPLEASSEASTQSGTLFHQINKQIELSKDDKNGVHNLQLEIDQNNGYLISEKLALKKEKERSFDIHISKIISLKAQIGFIISRALILASEFVYNIKYYNIKVNVSKLEEYKTKLISLSGNSQNYINDSDSDTIKVYEMILLCYVIGIDPKIFSRYSNVFRIGVTNCYCDPTPCSIASAMAISDNIIIYIDHAQFDESTTKDIKIMKRELISMLYSNNEDIKLLGAFNNIKLLLFDSTVLPSDIICRILQQLSDIDQIINNSRFYNVLDTFLKEYSSKSVAHYKCVIFSLMVYIILSFSSSCCNSIAKNTLLYQFSKKSAEDVSQNILRVIIKLLVSVCYLSPKKERCSPLYKVLYLLCLVHNTFNANKDILQVIRTLILNKTKSIGTTLGSKYKLMRLIKASPALSQDTMAAKFNEPIIRHFERLITKWEYPDEKLNKYCQKKIQMLNGIMSTVNKLGNQYLVEDIDHINMAYNENSQIQSVEKPSDIKFEDLLLGKRIYGKEKRVNQCDPNEKIKVLKI